MENKFWNIINIIDWESACNETKYPYEITRERFKGFINDNNIDDYFVREIIETAKAYRKILVTKVREYSFDTCGNRYSFPDVSDDRLWDLTAHIVGLGEKVYNKIMKHPELIEKYKNSYKENFEYTFN